MTSSPVRDTEITDGSISNNKNCGQNLSSLHQSDTGRLPLFIIFGKCTDDECISKESKPYLAGDAPVNNSYDPDSDSDSVTLVSETYSHFFKLSRAKMKRLEEFYRYYLAVYVF